MNLSPRKVYFFIESICSFIDSPCCIKSKRATKNPINKIDSKCVQYVVLNHGEIKQDPQRITKTKPFINKYNW